MEVVTKGIICLKGRSNLVYRIARIEYEEYENGDYSYKFYPNYSVIELLDSDLFQGIPGLDLSRRLVCYERKNITPVFISERTPGNNRVDLEYWLKKYNMDSLNRLEWLIRTDTQYSGDKMFVTRDESEEAEIKVNSMFDITKREDNIHKDLLKIICEGKYLESKEVNINDESRNLLHNVLEPIYYNYFMQKQKKIASGIEKAKKENKYKGRKQKKVDVILLKKLYEDFKNKTISLEACLKLLNISKATFYRKIKKN